MGRKEEIDSILGAYKKVKEMLANNMSKKIFTLDALYTPEMFRMVNYPRQPLAVFNPGAYERDGKLVMLPRLSFDESFYVSSIGLSEPLEYDALDIHKEISTRLLKYPEHRLEINGVEDARVSENGKLVWTVGVNRGDKSTQTTVMGFDGHILSKPRPLSVGGLIDNTGRDTVILNKDVLFFRPESRILITYRADYVDDGKFFHISRRDVVKELISGDTEKHTGLSTNAVRVYKNLYMIAWHSISKELGEYRQAFLLVDKDGFSLGTTDMILRLDGNLRYGNRPFTLFGCGLVLHGNTLYFVGGVGDWATVIYSADVNDVLSEIKNEGL